LGQNREREATGSGKGIIMHGGRTIVKDRVTAGEVGRRQLDSQGPASSEYQL
jgi:hypothetical protein